MESPILNISQLDFSYQEQSLLNRLNLTVNSGEIIGVLGPNGSGKSTLLKLINGILSPCNGTISLGNSDIQTLTQKEIARKIAFVPQQTVVSHGYSALEIVLMGRFPYKSNVALENKNDLETAHRTMSITSSLNLKNRRFDTLSGGEQQRVILASALAQEPEILLLDEPTSALDLYYQLHLFQTLTDLNANSQLTVIAAIHDINLASMFCHRIWLIDTSGGIIDGPPENVCIPSVLEPVFKVKLSSMDLNENKKWLIPISIQENHSW